MTKRLMADILLGIDPGQRFNGLAARDVHTGRTIVTSFAGIEEIAACKLIADLAAAYPDRTTLIHAYIECPTWGGFGTREMRAAAIVWERVLKAQPYHPRVKRVDPNWWQRQILGKFTPGTSKEMSMLYAQKALHTVCASDHEADAVCIAYYGSLVSSGVIELPKPKKRVNAKAARSGAE